MKVNLPDGTPVKLLTQADKSHSEIQPCWRCGSNDQEVLLRFNSATALHVYTHLMKCNQCEAQGLQRIANPT